jgi:sorbitol/mannitol transport system substrate-binding protein
MNNTFRQFKQRWSARGLSVCLLASAALATGCGTPGTTPDGGTGTVKLTIASVNNPQMKDLETLLPEFRKDNPNIEVDIVFLDENQVRENVTASVVNNTGAYDAFTIGTYEVPIWGKAGQILELESMLDSDYEPNDLIPGVAAALKVNSKLHAVPFYGESSMLMYRKDLIDAAKVVDATIAYPSAKPTWTEIRTLALKVKTALATAKPGAGPNGQNIPGICLRGVQGWGEMMAPLTTMVNAHGGAWFDLQWNALLNSTEWNDAVTLYKNILSESGQTNPTSYGFTECRNAFDEGKVAMWYDATVAASTFTKDTQSKSGYSYAPNMGVGKKEYTGWLWAWTLAIPSSTKHKAEAAKFLSWATSKKYIQLVGNTASLGWGRVPPGTRTSTYALAQYKTEAGAYADITLDSIGKADVNNPSTRPVPYHGVQYVDVPEFQELGNKVSVEIGKVYKNEQSVAAALTAAQSLASAVGEKYKR